MPGTLLNSLPCVLLNSNSVGSFGAKHLNCDNTNVIRISIAPVGVVKRVEIKFKTYQPLWVHGLTLINHRRDECGNSQHSILSI